jgi:adenosylhomocysteine nucleosidase
MWQPLLRSWLLGQAQQKMREAAAQAASQAAEQAKSAGQEATPEKKPPVCHVGCVFALAIEAGGLVDRLAGVVRTEGSGFVAREGGLEGRRIVIVESGAGSAAAAKATEALVPGHRPRWIISAGFAGGLDERVRQGDILMADTIVDQEGRELAIDFKLAGKSQNTPHVHVGRLLTVDRVIRDPAEKRALGIKHAALAVDMETMGVAQVCREEKVRFLSVRVIIDAVDRTLPHDIDLVVRKKSTAGRLGAAAGAIFRRPASIKDMWQLKEDALVASQRLATFLVGVVGQLEEKAEGKRQKAEG